MRPVEAIGMLPGDIIFDHDVPHVHIRKNAIRGLKTDHSERLVPLLGASLSADRALAARCGWGKQVGKSIYATTVVNHCFRETGLMTNKRQGPYSLRRWF